MRTGLQYGAAHELKSIDVSSGEFSGYLSVFDVTDSQKDSIVKGAFANTIQQLKSEAELLNLPFLLPVLYMHDIGQAIGGYTKLQEDAYGLAVEGWIDTSFDLGLRAYSGLKNGYCSGLSIGYRTIKDEMRYDNVRLLKEITLFEGSVVSMPSNRMCRAYTL